MARLLIDESLPRAVTRALLAGGHDVLDVRDLGLRGASDARIAARAEADARIIVSADVDFANALRFPPGTHPGICVARLPGGMTPAAAARRIVESIADMGPRLDRSIAIVELTRIRIFGRS